MLKLLRCFLPALVGLGMASAHAYDARFDAFMQTVSGNKSTISFGTNGTPVAVSSAPSGSAAVQSMGFTKTAEGVFMESIGSGRVPGTTSTVPISSKLKLSSLAIGRGLYKGAIAAFAIGSVWTTGSELYDIWTDLGVQRCIDSSKGPFCESQSSSSTSGLWGYLKQNDGYWAANVSSYVSSQNLACTNWVATQVSSASYNIDVTYTQTASLPASPTAGTTSLRVGTCSYKAYGKTTGRLDLSGLGYIHAYYYFGQSSQTTETALTEQQVIDQIANRSGWPDSSTLALQKALQYQDAQTALADAVEADTANKPQVKIGTVPQGTPVQIGEPVLETETATNPDGSTTTKTKTTTTTITAQDNELSTQSTTQTVTTTTSPTGETLSQSTTTTAAPTTSTGTGTGTGSQEQDGECGFGDNPNCKIEESGTPEATPDTSAADSQTLLETVTNCVSDLSACFQVPSISLTFSLPTGCGPLPVTAFGDFALSFDICEYQPTIHDLMSMLWAAAGLFGAAGLLFRSSGA